MSSDAICKTIHQYNKEPISEENMKKLQEIAEDYCKIKNYVYQRYSGINSLSKLYPGYTVQNEMIASGLREQLGLPFVYFNLAIFDALGDIKSQWTKTKAAVLGKVNSNKGFSEEDKHYLRYLLKVDNAFEAILNHKSVNLKLDLQKQYELLKSHINAVPLNNYLCRQVRYHHVKMHSRKAEGFSLTERAYRYGIDSNACHGIYITMKEKRKRIFIPLTDNNQYIRQIYLKLYPEQGNIEIKVPVDVKIRKYKDYTNQIGVAMGMQIMLVTDKGHVYGEKLGEYQIALADWIRQCSMKYHSDNEAESGRKKYTAQKQRKTEQLHSYINNALNNFLRTEKPETIYMPKLPKPQKYGTIKAINYSMNMWQRGYIKKRLYQKCQEQSIKVIEVWGKDISNECSQCGVLGDKKDGMFFCKACGYQIEVKQNTAQNAKKRGMDENQK